MESWQLKQRQSLPLEAKIARSTRVIREWHDRWEGQVYVAFSGGWDSTVLLHLVRSLYPHVPAVFADTGLEYPEIREFVKVTENVIWVKPKMNFKQVLSRYGYPVVSKLTAKALRRLQNPSESVAASNVLALTGIKRDGAYSPWFKLAKKWHRLIDAPFKISEMCCDIMKKKPMHAYEKETGRKPYIGMMASDSRGRYATYKKNGCNSFGAKPSSNPLGPWLKQDILDYTKSRNVPYCKIYDMGESTTGCIFCMFGVHMEKEPNRFQRMKVSHPKLYRYCMENLGLREVLEYIGVPHE